MGDCTPASLGNLGDLGLLVMDNKEQANFSQPLIDFCLFLATGAQRVRSYSDGTLRYSRYRPAGVITTIEGVFKPELQKRCVEVKYAVKGESLGRGQIELEISLRRNEICSALMVVLQKYFQIQGQRSNPNPIPEFEEHFSALCDLLRAFGEVAGKDENWAEAIISKWDVVIRGRDEEEEDELEQPLLRIFDLLASRVEFQREDIVFEGKRGKLYVTTSATLLTELQKLRLYDRALPKDARGLSRRLRGAKFKALRFLDSESAPEFESLRRTSAKRPIGFFFEDEATQDDDAMTMGDVSESEYRHHLIN